MAKKPSGLTKATALRRQAEERLRTTRRDVAAMPVKEVQQLVYELQVHQIELEMQNDELRQTQVELEAARDRYVDLYDFSPTGYLTLDMQGKIVEANLRAGTLLEVNRKKLIGQPLARFIAAADADTFHRHGQEVLKTGTRQTCEVQIREEAGVSRWVHMESCGVHDETRPTTHWRMSLQDISNRKLAEAKLEAQRTQREAIIGSMKDAIITIDERKRVVVFNCAAESIFLCPAVYAIGKPFDRFIPERFRQAHQGYVSVYDQKQSPFPAIGEADTFVGLRANGEEFHFEASISHSVVEGQKLLTAIVRDITERKKAAVLLQASQAFTRSVVNSIPAHVCVLNREGVILKTNDIWKVLVQEHSDGVFTIGEIGQNYFDLCRRTAAGSTSTGQAILQGLEAVLKGHEPIFSTEYCAEFPEEKRWFLMRVTPLKGGKGVVILHTDISERVRMAQELEENVVLLDEKRKEMESLTGKLIEAQEQERRRIARDLHDDFNQRLAALSVELEIIERDPSDRPEHIARQLAAIRGQVGHLSDDLHDLAYNLHPSLLDHVGLELAIREHVVEFAKLNKAPVIYTPREVPATLPPQIATGLFRVMQESLQNVSKHAAATNVTVRLFGSSKGIGLSVRDNGKGFESNGHKAHHAGLGLVSMQERIRLLGGCLQINSQLGQGTKVCAWIPLSQEGE
ncbi:MAG TPA: PAS domain S-box protein [Nitrospiraceae bacterium]